MNCPGHQHYKQHHLQYTYTHFNSSANLDTWSFLKRTNNHNNIMPNISRANFLKKIKTESQALRVPVACRKRYKHISTCKKLFYDSTLVFRRTFPKNLERVHYNFFMCNHFRSCTVSHDLHSSSYPKI